MIYRSTGAQNALLPALFAQAGRCHAKHRDDAENDSASANLDNDVAAQLPERTARPGSNSR